MATIIESFRVRKEDTLPIELEINGKTSWEEYYEYSREQDKRVDLAMGRMRLCSFINGMLNPFSAPKTECLGFKWCPHKEWEKHFKKVL